MTVFSLHFQDTTFFGYFPASLVSLHCLLLTFSLVALHIIYVLFIPKIILSALFLLWAQPVSLAFFLTSALRCLKRILNLRCPVRCYFLLSWNLLFRCFHLLKWHHASFRLKTMEPIRKSLVCTFTIYPVSDAFHLCLYCPPALLVWVAPGASCLLAFALHRSLVVHRTARDLFRPNSESFPSLFQPYRASSET